MPSVLLVCSGLDHAHRGFESFARECFEELRDEPGVRIELVKGSGPKAPSERAVPTLRRDRLPARGLGKLLGKPAFRIEAFAFAFAVAPLLARRRPDVVYLSEWDTGRGLARIRRALGLQFKLLLSNGTLAAAGFGHFDHVQELTPAGRDHVIGCGADPAKHTLLPLGVRVPAEFQLLADAARAALKRRLGLPEDRAIVLSVAAFNRSAKRLDYLIEEVAALPEPRPFLLLVGQPEEETPLIRSLARQHLGEEGFAMRTVPATEMVDLYRASDVFVLASLVEAQGRVLIEAMSNGLPCIAHDSPVIRFALGEHGTYGDLTQRGALTRLLARTDRIDPAAARAAHRYAYERFGWEALRARYVALLRMVAYGAPSVTEPAAANNTVSSSTGEDVFR